MHSFSLAGQTLSLRVPQPVREAIPSSVGRASCPSFSDRQPHFAGLSHQESSRTGLRAGRFEAGSRAVTLMQDHRKRERDVYKREIGSAQFW